MKSSIIWHVGLAVRFDGAIDHYVRKDDRLQLVEKKTK